MAQLILRSATTRNHTSIINLFILVFYGKCQWGSMVPGSEYRALSPLSCSRFLIAWLAYWCGGRHSKPSGNGIYWCAVLVELDYLHKLCRDQVSPHATSSDTNPSQMQNYWKNSQKRWQGGKMGAASAYLCFFIPVVSLLPLYCTCW